ncbi:hypothetical protein EAG_01955 [Camponotus floridanus]|uniref:Uncharacterized protein n=1 Tax=Camponotus floridanus TaxID=104421 RepID=E2A1Z8_CAMFO|nr:hypothetical protein EAG_01955 [Camponotus floridanus]
MAGKRKGVQDGNTIPGSSISCSHYEPGIREVTNNQLVTQTLVFLRCRLVRDFLIPELSYYKALPSLRSFASFSSPSPSLSLASSTNLINSLPVHPNNRNVFESFKNRIPSTECQSISRKKPLRDNGSSRSAIRSSVKMRDNALSTANRFCPERFCVDRHRERV